MANDKTIMVQGRIVYTIGDLFKGDVAKSFGTQTPKLNKQGQQYREYGFGLAVPKSSLSATEGIWAAIHEVAYMLFPSRQIPPNFHMKFKDGDTGTNQDGTPLNVKEGYPGHIVFTCKTTFPIKFFKFENNQNFQITEGIKCGDYVNVQLNIDTHTGTNAGLYLNPYAVQLLGYGKEIVNAPSGDQIFGTRAPMMPAGASAMPVAPAGMIAPMSQGPVQGFAPPLTQAYQQPVTMQQQAPPAPIQPNYGVLPPAYQPQQAPMQQQAPVPGFAPPPAPMQQTYPAMPPIPR